GGPVEVCGLRHGDPGVAAGRARRARYRDRRRRLGGGVRGADRRGSRFARSARLHAGRRRRGGLGVSSLAYTRYELLRVLRNRRFFFLSLGFPLVLYFLIAGSNRNTTNLANTGISAPLYFMVGMIAFG